MTAYLMTEAQHAQIVDALEFAPNAAGPEDSYQDEHFKAKADSFKRCQAALAPALAMLKAMKPVEPVAHLVYDPIACSEDLYFDDELGDMDGKTVEPLYALGDTA